MTKDELAIKVDEFVKKYEGQTLGYPEGQYIGQCLSLVKIYIKEVFGINPPPSGSNSAYGYWINFPNPLSEVFVKVPSNGASFKGCIPIWNTSVGNGFGHIDILLETNEAGFVGFDANWGGTKAHKQTHNYANVVGWLAPKLDIIAPQPVEPIITEQTKIPQIDNLQVDQIRSKLNDQTRDLTNLQKDKELLQAQFEMALVANKEYEKRLSEITADRERLKKQIETLANNKLGPFALFGAQIDKLFKKSKDGKA